MAVNSAIEWTDATWNPVTGCSKVSLGCRNCYAERMARRLQAMGSPNYANGFHLTVHPRVLEAPLRWRRARNVFVNSMGDLFHDGVPFDFIQRVFEVMTRASHHRFQILTKRAERLATVAARLTWPDNVWMGVTVETSDYVDRIHHLRETQAKIKFLSLEPLLGPMSLVDLNEIDWVIVGGESGPRARAVSTDWIRGIRDQCVEADVPFFFKQWGGKRRKKAGRTLDGRTWDQMPRT
jgi:protein gp37